MMEKLTTLEGAGVSAGLAQAARTRAAASRLAPSFEEIIGIPGKTSNPLFGLFL